MAILHVLLYIAYAQRPPLNIDADISIRASGLNIGPSHHLHPYFVYASREGRDFFLQFWEGALGPFRLGKLAQ